MDEDSKVPASLDAAPAELERLEGADDEQRLEYLEGLHRALDEEVEQADTPGR